MEIYKDDKSGAPANRRPVPKGKGLSMRPPEPASELSEPSVNATQGELDKVVDMFSEARPFDAKNEPFDVPVSPVHDDRRNFLPLREELGQPDLEVDNSLSQISHDDSSHVLTPRDKQKVETLMETIKVKLMEISEIIEPDKHNHLLRASMKKKKKKKRSKKKKKPAK